MSGALSKADLGVEKEEQIGELLDDVPEELLPAAETQMAAYDRLLGFIRMLVASLVMRIRFDVRLAAANAREGFAKMLPHMDVIRATPDVDVASIERIPDLAAGLLYADSRVTILEPPPSDLPRRLRRMRQLRKAFLRQMQAAAALELIPEGPVERVLQGSGPIDNAADLVRLTALFREHAHVLKGCTLFTPALLEEAERVGTDLQNELRSGKLPAKAKEVDPALVLARDDRARFGTLLAQSYAELQRVARFRKLDSIPSLQARKPLRKKTASDAPSN